MTEQRDNLPVVPAAEETAKEAETVTEAAVTAAEELSSDVTETAVQAADEVKEAVADTFTEAKESSEETISNVTEAVGEAAESVDEAASGVTETAAGAVSDAADTLAEAGTEAADKAEDEAEEAAEEVTDEVSEAADKEDEAASTDHFKNIISAAEHSAEKTSQKLANFDDIFFKMPSDETELKDEADKAVVDESVSVYNMGIEGPQDEKPVIVFENVHKEYEGQIEDSVALTDVSFSIRKGDFVFIVGPSGSGKSTMIRLMMREISPSSGKILIAGKNLAKLRKRQVSKYRRNIGIVFQDFRLLPDRSVYDNVAFAQRVVGAPKRNIPKEVSKVLHLVGLSQKYKSFPNELSGGEQQRVAIARALVNNPMIILADEPTGNLDPQNSYEIMSLLEEINRRGTTVVIVTHDREVVNRMQKRVVVLQEGTIVEDKRGGYNRG